MNKFLTMLAFGTLMPLFAAAAATSLTVNAPELKETVTDEASLTVNGAAVLQASEIMVVRTTATFTLPSQSPDFNTVADDKLAVAADTDGTILVSDSTGWASVTRLKVADGETVVIEAVGRVADGKLHFDVTLTKGEMSETVAVVSPATDAVSKKLSEVAFEGKGSATNLSVAQVNTGILPAPEGGHQDPAQVDKYVAWANDETKGKQMADAEPEAQQNAFAMNVGGTPKLEITAVDTVAKTITVHGSYEPTPGETLVAPLDKINGTLYLTYSDSLSGTVHVTDQVLKVAAGGDLTVTLPEGAVFVKATVSLVQPSASLTK